MNRMLKKGFILITLIISLIHLAGCGVSESDFVGKWRLSTSSPSKSEYIELLSNKSLKWVIPNSFPIYSSWVMLDDGRITSKINTGLVTFTFTGTYRDDVIDAVIESNGREQKMTLVRIKQTDL